MVDERRPDARRCQSTGPARRRLISASRSRKARAPQAPPGIRRPSSSLHPPFVHLVAEAIVPHCVGPRTRLRTALEHYYSSTPGALAQVRVIVSRSVISF